MKDVGGAGFAGSSPPFLGRERATVDVDPERRSPRYHEILLLSEWRQPTNPSLDGNFLSSSRRRSVAIWALRRCRGLASAWTGSSQS